MFIIYIYMYTTYKYIERYDIDMIFILRERFPIPHR